MAAIVLDVNLLVRAILVPGCNSAKILDLARSGRVTLLISEEIIEEARRVLTYPRVAEGLSLSRAELEDFLTQLRDFARYVRPSGPLEAVSGDPSGDKYLECAASGQADFIVTRDRMLLAMGRYQAIPIVSPADFLADEPGQPLIPPAPIPLVSS
jgi:putative PIN family toxin of toxin-antitoxin system